MRRVGVALIALFALSAAGCAMRTVNLDVPAGATDVSTLEWRWNIERYLRLYEIDQVSHDAPGFGTARYRIPSGRHVLRFVYFRPLDVYEYQGAGRPSRNIILTSGDTTLTVAFDAEPGHAYRVETELLDYREPTVETGGRDSARPGRVRICLMDTGTRQAAVCETRELAFDTR